MEDTNHSAGGLDISKDETTRLTSSQSTTDSSKHERHFEEILDQVGSFGRWQKMIFFIICLPDLLGGSIMLFPVFAGATPHWHCSEYTSDLNGSIGVNGSTFLNTTADTCDIAGGWICTGFEFKDDFTSAVGEWDLLCGSRYIVSLISSVQMVGVAIGAVVFGYLADWFGRKKCYYATVTLMIVGGVGSGLSYSWVSYAVNRFFAGSGYGGFMVINCTYPLEFVGPRWRIFCGTIGFWAVGVMLFALMGFFIRDWRHLAIATSCIGLLYFPTWFILPESPRWLLQRGRIKEAYDIVHQIAKWNKKETPSFSLLLKISERSRKENTTGTMYTYLDLFRTKEYAKRTVAIMCLWFYGNSVYYWLCYNMRTFSGNRYLNMFLGGFVDLPAMLSVLILCKWLGRRTLLIVYHSISVLALSCFTCMYVTEIAGVTIYVESELTLTFGLFGRAAVMGQLYVCQIYCAELFATVVRALGTGAGAVAARIGCIVAPQMVLLGTYVTIAPCIIYLVLGLFIVGFTALLPETRGKPMDELPPHSRKRQINKDALDQMNDTTKPV